MKQSFQWNKVTPLSKYLAMICFIIFPFLGFYCGRQYQKLITPTEVSTQVVAPEKLVSEVSYKCDAGKQIKASYYAGPTVTVAPGEPPKPTGSVKLTLSDGRQMTLSQTISGSGIRYATSDEAIIFWSKGKTAFVTENKAETYSNCNQY